MKFIKLNILLNFVIFFFLNIPIISIAQPGSLDLSFDGDGIVSTQIGTVGDQAYSVATQADGKIVVVGTTSVSGITKIALLRYNLNGSLDNSFDSDGIVTTLVGNSSTGISVAIQSDGKIVVGGTSDNGAVGEFAVLRYNTNGSLDNSFDSDGIMTTTIGSSISTATSLKIQNDGKIVLAGSSLIGLYDAFACIRLNTDGSLDNTFDSDGIVTTLVGTSNAEALSLTIQANGKLVITGTSSNFMIGDILLARYNSDGSLDNSFDSDGIVITNLGNEAAGWGVTTQSDGKILVAGTENAGTINQIVLIRYNTDGSLDNSFDSDGITTTLIGTDGSYGTCLSIQTDGKILVGGSSLNGVNQNFSLVRYNSNGSLDNSFDSDGIVTTIIGDGSTVYALAIQNDGKIVTAGLAYGVSTPNVSFALARYNSSFPAGIELVNNQTSNIEIFPNPFTSFTTIKSRNGFNNASLSFYNLNGQQLKVMNSLNGNSFRIERDNLPTGTYFIEVKEENKIPFKQKLSIIDLE